MRGMVIRDAREEDLAFILRGLADNRLLEGRSVEQAAATEADERAYASSVARGTVRILEEGGEAIGFLSYALDFDVMYVSGGFVWIDLVYVHEDHRGRGLGKRLYEEAERLARANGCDRVVADVFAANRGSLAFHERVGFAPLYTIFEKTVAPTDQSSSEPR